RTDPNHRIICAMAVMDWGLSYRRQNFEPLDISYVFDSLTELEDYLSSAAIFATPFNPDDLKGFPYSGQITAVLNGTNQPDVYVIWEATSGTANAVESLLFPGRFFAYAPFEGGGPPPAPFQYVQTPAADVWDITHNLNQRYVSTLVV